MPGMVGFAFQYHYLFSGFTALENVMMPLLLERGGPDESMQQTARGLLQKVGLTPWENNLATNMSGGQQQRVAIARALALNPRLILADEPTGNLDTQTANSVFELMRQVSAASGATVRLVTHNMDLAGRCDRVVTLVTSLIGSYNCSQERPDSRGDRHGKRTPESDAYRADRRCGAAGARGQPAQQGEEDQ
jgi:lipoprotein-releasing system ATP-binding protein